VSEAAANSTANAVDECQSCAIMGALSDFSLPPGRRATPPDMPFTGKNTPFADEGKRKNIHQPAAFAGKYTKRPSDLYIHVQCKRANAPELFTAENKLDKTPGYVSGIMDNSCHLYSQIQRCTAMFTCGIKTVSNK
jgi:hypothetical protein